MGQFVDRFFVWLVAMLAGLGAIGNCIQAALAGQIENVTVWGTIAIAMTAGTLMLESVKFRGAP